MIEFQKVTKIYKTKNKREVLALKDVSFKVKEGEFLIIFGPSGAGKTTILKIILGQEKPTFGKVFFEGKEISKLKNSEILKLRKKIGVVFQDYKLLEKKNLFENLSFIMEISGFSDEKIKNDIPKVLELVGLKEKMESFPQELSFGERQRAAIARALVHRPILILADEPTGNLDASNSLQVLKIFKKINELGKTVILATHNKENLEFLKKRVIYLENGRIVS